MRTDTSLTPQTPAETGRHPDAVTSMLIRMRQIIELDRSCYPGRCQMGRPRRPRHRDLMIRPHLSSRRMQFAPPEELAGTLVNALS
ncbi:hypothetical protein [Desulfovibrio inopinatus]|uniref:hypothetical protein n=1 Tax=Desulfovibrio inopinatus TaxID=102109 RepID=UPI0012EB3916|nr:hypothetical protein [Desulfovibrio inopinatus]